MTIFKVNPLFIALDVNTECIFLFNKIINHMVESHYKKLNMNKHKEKTYSLGFHNMCIYTVSEFKYSYNKNNETIERIDTFKYSDNGMIESFTLDGLKYTARVLVNDKETIYTLSCKERNMINVPFISIITVNDKSVKIYVSKFPIHGSDHSLDHYANISHTGGQTKSILNTHLIKDRAILEFEYVETSYGDIDVYMSVAKERIYKLNQFGNITQVFDKHRARPNTSVYINDISDTYVFDRFDEWGSAYSAINIRTNERFSVVKSIGNFISVENPFGEHIITKFVSVDTSISTDILTLDNNSGKMHQVFNGMRRIFNGDLEEIEFVDSFGNAFSVNIKSGTEDDTLKEVIVSLPTENSTIKRLYKTDGSIKEISDYKPGFLSTIFDK